MEEFEEAEKKQTTVKKDTTVKKEVTKKVKSPAALSGVITGPLTIATTPVLKIKDFTTVPKVEPIAVPHVQSQTVQQKSPIAGTSTVMSPTKPLSQTVAKTPPDNKGSVIKLLLSSPTQSAGPAPVPQLSQSSPEVKTPAAKKGKGKVKATAGVAETNQIVKVKQALETPGKETTRKNVGGIHIKKELHEDMEEDIELVKLEAEKSAAQAKKSKKGGKKSISITDESPFMPPPAPSPNVIHVGPMTIGLDVKVEPKAKKGKKTKGRASQDKLDMGDAMEDNEYGIGMPEIELGDAGNDSFMDIEDDDEDMDDDDDDEDSLMIKEEEYEEEKPKGKQTKKKMQKLKTNVQLGDMTSAGWYLVNNNHIQTNLNTLNHV